MIKQGLELKQQQKLSPLQIQTIKLIELPVQELEQRVRAELEDNPVLDDTPDPEKEPEDQTEADGEGRDFKREAGAAQQKRETVRDQRKVKFH